MLGEHRVEAGDDRQLVLIESGATFCVESRKRRSIAVANLVAAHRVKVVVQRETALTVHRHKCDGADGGARKAIAQGIGLRQHVAY